MEIAMMNAVGSPPAAAIMPKVNETDKYPSAMGTPSRSPFANRFSHAAMLSPAFLSHILPHYCSTRRRKAQAFCSKPFGGGDRRFRGAHSYFGHIFCRFVKEPFSDGQILL